MCDKKQVYSLASNKTFCNYCPGYCCYNLPGAMLLIHAEDINRLALHFDISDGEVRKRFMDGKNSFRNRADGSCIFLANGKICKRCSIHLARPKQCKEFPYEKPCPYLEREDLLDDILPRLEKSLNLDR